MSAAATMTKTEAADIIATNISAWCYKHDVDDSDMQTLVGTRARTLIAEAISRMTHETVEGSYAHTAALLRPSDRTVLIAYRRASGLNL